MIWAIRGLLLGAFILVGGLALVTAAKEPPRPEPVAQPQPTREPTLVLPPAPERIVSRIARETATPAPQPTPSGIPDIAVVDYGYAPAQLQIKAGAIVRWTNRGDDGHDVTGSGPGGAWRSGPLAQGESYQRPFALPGDYPYVCSIHPEMRGFVTVVQP